MGFTYVTSSVKSSVISPFGVITMLEHLDVKKYYNKQFHSQPTRHKALYSLEYSSNITASMAIAILMHANNSLPGIGTTSSPWWRAQAKAS